jgi:hypothetical protein
MGRGASGSLGMFWRGSLDALESGRRLGFCGSRKASDGALKQTAALARRAALAGWVRVHGGARGADQACALAKPESVQIIVLGGGLAELERRHPLRGLFGGPNLALSPFPLFAPIAQWSLVRRNRAIAALSEALAVAETAPDGGSRHAALMALKLGRAVFVFEGVEEADNARRKKRASEPLDTLSRAEAEAGRRRLVQAGARRLAVGRVCRLPSEELERTLFPAHPAAGKPASQAPPKAIQGELF